MAESRRRRRRSRDIVAADIEVLPLMNLFIVLIPLLLLSAVFIHVSVIDMTLPAAAEAAGADEARLDLTVRIGAHTYRVEGNGIEAREVARTSGAAGAQAPDQATRDWLAAVLREVAAAYPDQKDVRIVSGPHVRYDEIVAVMDVARSAGLPYAALGGADDGAS